MNVDSSVKFSIKPSGFNELITIYRFDLLNSVYNVSWSLRQAVLVKIKNVLSKCRILNKLSDF